MGIIRSKEELERIRLSGKLTDEEFEELRIASTPSLWCEKYLKGPDSDNNTLPIVYEEFQKEFLNSMNPSRSLLCGRGAGKTVTLVSDILWECCTEKDVKIFYYLPGLSQLERMYEVMDNMIANSEYVSSLISVDKKSKEVLNKKDQIEHVINFTTGSKVIFFVCASNITKIRSHHGGKVYIDEAAEIKEAAFEAILGVLTNTKSPKLVMAGTPKGKHGTFYHYTEDSGTHRIWQPSWKSRHWTPEKEAIARRMCPEENRYMQEYGAIFITDDSQVYPDEDINKCVNKTESVHGKYVSSKYGKNGAQYLDEEQLARACLFNYENLFIGIDWNNPVNGVQIVFLTEKTHNGRLECQVAKIISISNREFTQLDSVKKIIEIYKEYNPTAIYADAGYGCLPGWAKVETINGHTFMRDLKVGDMVLTASGRYKRVEAINHTVPRIIWNIELPHGEYLDSSHTHRFLIGLSDTDPEETQYLLPGDIKAGMKLAINRSINNDITSDVKIDLSFLLQNNDKIAVKKDELLDISTGIKYKRILNISCPEFIDLIALVNNYLPTTRKGVITIPDNGGILSSEYRKNILHNIAMYLNEQNNLPGVNITLNNTGAEIKVEGEIARAILFGERIKEYFKDDMSARFAFTSNLFLNANHFTHTTKGNSICIKGHPIIGRLLLNKGIYISHAIQEDDDSVGYIHPQYGKKYFDIFNKLTGSGYKYPGGAKRGAVTEVGSLFLCRIESLFQASFMGERYYDIQVADDRSYVACGFTHHNSVQTELILQYAKTNNMTDLLNKYRTIDFSSNIEIENPDPFNRILRQKDKVTVRIKNHMISLLVGAFKDGMIALPAFECEKGGLIDELRQFQLKSETIKGEPIYSKKGGQHKHMALALAYYARYEYHRNINTPAEATLGSLGLSKIESSFEEHKTGKRTNRELDLVMSVVNLNPYDNSGMSYDRNGDLF
jgi:hypothetical protein